MTVAPPAAYWIPEVLAHANGHTRCQWIDIGDVRFTDPFFQDTLARRRRDRPERRSTSIEQLIDDAAAVDGPPPTAFIFHVSRCGSTLLAQLLACDDGAIVLSEVPVLDEILRSTLPRREEAFAAALRLLARRRVGDEARLFIKADCWHLLYADTLRTLYPGTPFVLLYRNPEEVLRSHRRARGMHLVPGLLERAPFNIPFDPAMQTLDAYAAAVLGTYYAAMADFAVRDAGSLLVNYAEGFPDAYWRVAGWLGLPNDNRVRGLIEARCGFDAKNPGSAFTTPPASAIPGVEPAPLRRHYERLEHLRKG